MRASLREQRGLRVPDSPEPVRPRSLPSVSIEPRTIAGRGIASSVRSRNSGDSGGKIILASPGLHAIVPPFQPFKRNRQGGAIDVVLEGIDGASRGVWVNRTGCGGTSGEPAGRGA